MKSVYGLLLLFLLAVPSVSSAIFGYNYLGTPGGGNNITIYNNNTYINQTNIFQGASSYNETYATWLPNYTQYNKFWYNQSSSFYSWLSNFLFNYNQTTPAINYINSNPMGFYNSTNPQPDENDLHIGNFVNSSTINNTVLFIDGNGNLAQSNFFKYQNAQLNLTQVNGIVPLLVNGNVTVKGLVIASNLCYSNGTNCNVTSTGTFNATYDTWLPNYTAYNKYWYNQSDGSYNITYQTWAYNQSSPFYSWLSTFVYNYNQTQPFTDWLNTFVYNYNQSVNTSNFVPYTGAISNIDLNGKKIINISSLSIGNSNIATQALDLTGRLRMGSTDADEVAKYSYLLSKPYNNSEVDMLAFIAGNQNLDSYIKFGGGSSVFNAVNFVSFYSAPNKSTLNGFERMRIDGNGNIGIGTTAPTSKLDIHGTGATTGITFATANSSGTTNNVIFDNGQIHFGGSTVISSGTKMVITADIAQEPLTLQAQNGYSLFRMQNLSGFTRAWFGNDAGDTFSVKNFVSGGNLLLTTNGTGKVIIDNGELYVRNNINSTQNVTATYFKGDGSLLTDISTFNQSYDNHINNFTAHNNTFWYNQSQPVLDYVNERYNVTKEPTGFTEQGVFSSSLNFNDATRNFTINGTYTYYWKGNKFTKTNSDSVIIPTTAGVENYIYFDGSDGSTLTQSIQPWGNDFLNVVQVATVFWNGSNGLIGKERHGLEMDGATHQYLHTTVGTRYESGFTGSFTSGFNWNLTAGVIADEDNVDSNPFQNLTRVFYHTPIGKYTFTPQQKQMFYNISNIIQYDNLTGTSDVAINQYVAYWIVESVDRDTPTYTIMGQRTDINLANAQANNKWESMVLTGFDFPEYKLLYRVILQRQGTSDPTVADIQDLRSISNLPSGTYVATSHGALTGLLNDDHPQYLLVDGTRNMTNNLNVNGNITTSNYFGNGNTLNITYNYNQSSIYSYNHTNATYNLYNASWSATFNQSYDNLLGRNKTVIDALNVTNLFYNYNQSDGSYNITYQTYAYNQTQPFADWLSTFVYNYNQSSIYSYNHTTDVYNLYNASWSATYNESAFYKDAGGHLNMTGENITALNSIWFVNSSGQQSIYGFRMNSASTITTNANFNSQSDLSYSRSLFSTGATGAFWMGTSTQNNAKLRLYPSGEMVGANITLNGTGYRFTVNNSGEVNATHYWANGVQIDNFAYNMSDGSYNITYQTYAYNQTQPFTDWLSTFQYNYNQTTPFTNWLSTFAYNYNQSSVFSYNHTVDVYNLYNASWSATYNESAFYKDAGGHLNMTGENITQLYGLGFVNSSGGASTIFVRPTGGSSLTLTGQLTVTARLISDDDISTSGAGDDLFLGTSTLNNAKFIAYATGEVRASNMTLNGTDGSNFMIKNQSGTPVLTMNKTGDIATNGSIVGLKRIDFGSGGYVKDNGTAMIIGHL